MTKRNVITGRELRLDRTDYSFTEDDTLPGVPSSVLLAETACCVGMVASRGEGPHSSDCAEITAVETPKALRKCTPFPPRRVG